MTARKYIFLCLSLYFFSCEKSSSIFLPIRFGISEIDQKSEKEHLVENKFLKLSINTNGDTSYYRNMVINDTPILTHFRFNYDHLGIGGPLRLYSYSLATLPYNKTKNKLVGVPVYYLDNEVCLVSTFSQIKSFLDKNYGNSEIITNVQDDLLNRNDTTFKYSLDTVDIYLIHSPIASSYDYKVNLEYGFYERAYLNIVPKNYYKEISDEKERRLELLKPKDVLEIRFNSMKIYDDTDENGLSKIGTTANFEDFKTDLINSDIVEAKGILACTNSFNDTMMSHEIIYKFDPPLIRHGIIGRSRELALQSFFLKPFVGDYYSLVSEQILQGKKIKVSFEPTAIVFSDGTVIK